MKKLVGLIVVVAALFIAFNYFSTGELFPSGSASSSDEAAALNRLRGDFRAAAQEFRQAGRSAALAGVDTTAAAEAALEEAERVEKEVDKIARATQSDELRAEAEDLLADIAKWRSDIR